MLKILSVFGTRPEAIKLAPVLGELDRHSRRGPSVVCVTGQHRAMLDDDPAEHARIARAANLYSDGHAAEGTVRLLLDADRSR